jgi:hypothetical protein
MNRAMRLSLLIAALSALALLNTGLAPARGAPRVAQATALEGASAAYRLDWAAMGEISGGASASAHYRLSATIGQMGAGTGSNSAGYGLCAGLQCASANDYRVYLPVVIR